MFGALAIFGFVKGIFSSDNPNASHNRLTGILMAIMLGFIIILLVLTYIGRKDAAEQKKLAQAAVLQLNSAVQENINMNKVIAKQQTTNTQAIEVVNTNEVKKETIKKRTYVLKKSKAEQINVIKEAATNSAKAAPSPESVLKIKTQEQDEISQIQINTIWTAYCEASGNHDGKTCDAQVIVHPAPASPPAATTQTTPPVITILPAATPAASIPSQGP